MILGRKLPGLYDPSFEEYAWFPTDRMRASQSTVSGLSATTQTWDDSVVLRIEFDPLSRSVFLLLLDYYSMNDIQFFNVAGATCFTVMGNRSGGIETSGSLAERVAGQVGLTIQDTSERPQPILEIKYEHAIARRRYPQSTPHGTPDLTGFDPFTYVIRSKA